jgi:multicomponent Na+:H+ antiporter subunit B
MIGLLEIFLLCLTVITAVGVVRATNLFAAVMLMGILSLLMAAVFFLLDAPDVALTEAAVGAGISTVLMLSALALTAEKEHLPGARPWLPLIVVFVTAGAILYATFDKPPMGDPEAPVHQHVAPEYFDMTREAVDIPNVVTAVLAAFRGYDTLGEVIVVFTAGIGVLFLIGPGAPKGGVSPSGGDLTPQGLKHHQPLRIVGKIAIPFILLFAFYVQWHGEYSPGGGFQAGALLASAVILYGLLEGENRALAVIPPRVLEAMAAGGALLYGGVGILCMLLGGRFLEYRVLADDPVKAQQIGILVIEAGVGVTVAGVLLTIYHAFAARDSA